MLLQLLVVISKHFSILDHAFNIFRGKAVLVVCDCDLFFVASALVLGRHLKDTVGINLKGHLNLGDTSWGRWDASQVKLSEDVVVLCHRSLSLKHLDGDSVLVV